MVEVFTTRPDLVKRSTKRRAQPVFNSQRPSPAGSVSAISCTRGCRNSAISTIWPSAACTSARTRSKRLGRIFSSATRTVSS